MDCFVAFLLAMTAVANRPCAAAPPSDAPSSPPVAQAHAARPGHAPVASPPTSLQARLQRIHQIDDIVRLFLCSAPRSACQRPCAAPAPSAHSRIVLELRRIEISGLGVQDMAPARPCPLMIFGDLDAVEVVDPRRAARREAQRGAKQPLPSGSIAMTCSRLVSTIRASATRSCPSWRRGSRRRRRRRPCRPARCSRDY